MAAAAENRMVQALRAVACIMVVLYHARRAAGLPDWPNGAAGVDLFFVISGYVMLRSSRRLIGQPDAAPRFLLRRALRIVPLYWGLTAVKFAIGTLRPELTPASHEDPWKLAASLAFIPVYDASGQLRPILPVGWSLDFEVFFYLLFAIALAARVHPLWIAPALLGAGDGRMLEFLAGMLVAQEESSSFLKKRTKKLLQIASGKWLHVWPPRLAAMSKSFSVLFFKKELLLLALPVLCCVPPCGAWHCLAWGLPASLLVAAAVMLEPKYGPRLPSWLLGIGNASYAIYLIHPFVVPVLARHGAVAAAAILPASVAAGWLVHRWVDAPLQRRLARGRRMPADYAGAGVLSG